jgi:hypothetical protein
MTAVATARGVRTARLSIPFFWWVREADVHSASSSVEAEYAYTASDNDYIPSSTADLWKSSSRRSYR